MNIKTWILKTNCTGYKNNSKTISIIIILLFVANTIIAQDTLPKRHYSGYNIEIQAGMQSKYFDANIVFFYKINIAAWYGGPDIGINYNTISIGPKLGLQYTCRFLSFKTDLVSGYMFRSKTFDMYFNPRIGIHFKHRFFFYYGYCLKLYKTNSIEIFKGHNFNIAYRLAI